MYFLGGKATRIIDRFGLVHTLTYESSGALSTVKEPAGRVLRFTNSLITGAAPSPVILKVEALIPISPGSSTFTTVKTIDFTNWSVGGSSGYCAPQTVTYSGEPAPAIYNYQYVTGVAGGGLGTGAGWHSGGFILTRADDPHVEGKMTVISYTYQGQCPYTPYSCSAPRVPCIYWSGLGALAEERNGLDQTTMVSRLTFVCNNTTPGKGTRIETKGSGSYQRTFKYGTGTGPDGMPIGSIMSELAQRTDFTNSLSVSEKIGLDYTVANPTGLRRFYDFLNNKTAVSEDAFQQPQLVTHTDGSAHSFSYAPLGEYPGSGSRVAPQSQLVLAVLQDRRTGIYHQLQSRFSASGHENRLSRRNF